VSAALRCENGQRDEVLNRSPSMSRYKRPRTGRKSRVAWLGSPCASRPARPWRKARGQKWCQEAFSDNWVAKAGGVRVGKYKANLGRSEKVPDTFFPQVAGLGSPCASRPRVPSRSVMLVHGTVSRLMGMPTAQKARGGRPETTESPSYQVFGARKQGATVTQCHALSFGK